MNCESIQPNLLDYSKGLLSRSESDKIKAHLGKCAECAAVLEEEVALDCQFAALPEELPKNDVWALVRTQIKPKRLGMVAFMRSAYSCRATRFVTAGVALAAVVVGVSISQQPSKTQQPQVVQKPAQVAVASDEPLAKHTDVMIAILEGR